MGTYGRGEIAALCEWVKPTVGVITAIGPVHLERMKSLDGIVAAKSEIFECVETAILNVDAYGLAGCRRCEPPRRQASARLQRRARVRHR